MYGYRRQSYQSINPDPFHDVYSLGVGYEPAGNLGWAAPGRCRNLFFARSRIVVNCLQQRSCLHDAEQLEQYQDADRHTQQPKYDHLHGALLPWIGPVPARLSAAGRGMPFLSATTVPTDNKAMI